MALNPDDVTVVPNAAAWRAFLDAHEETSDGVWLVLAKKGITSPTSLTYAQALDEALCSGWIDGQRRSRDETTFLQLFTPRRSRSLWSVRNVGIVARLRDERRMRPRGEREVDLAKADGRWERAYAGQANAVAPEDLLAALAAVPGALERFEAMPKQERFITIAKLTTAPSDTTRARRFERIVASFTLPSE